MVKVPSCTREIKFILEWISAFLMTVSYWKNLTISRAGAGMEEVAYLPGSGGWYIQRGTNPPGCILLQIALVPKIGDTLKF